MGFSSNKTEAYPVLTGKLDEYFFNHLGKVTTLSIKAPVEGSLGLERESHPPLALLLGQMPLLNTLNLEYIFAFPEQIHFLAGHKDILEKLTLRICYTSPNGLTKNQKRHLLVQTLYLPLLRPPAQNSVVLN